MNAVTMALINVWPIFGQLIWPSWMALEMSTWLKKISILKIVVAAAQYFTPKCSEINCRSLTIKPFVTKLCLLIHHDESVSLNNTDLLSSRSRSQ